MSATVRREDRDRLAVLWLDKPRANAIDRALIDDLRTEVDRVATEPETRGVLLASAHPRVFSPGLDLRMLLEADREGLVVIMRGFVGLLRALYGLEKPVVAGISGHAVAGGFILALCADHRILSVPGPRMGLNEGQAGVPLPWPVTALMRDALPPHRIVEIALLARDFSGRDAVEAGVAHEVQLEAGFLETCLTRLDRLASKEASTFGQTKRYLRREALEAMAADEERHLLEFADGLLEPAVQARIEAAVAALDGNKEPT